MKFVKSKHEWYGGQQIENNVWGYDKMQAECELKLEAKPRVQLASLVLICLFTRQPVT